MNDNEIERVTQLLVATAEIMGTELKPGAVMVMVSDLAEYEFQDVMNALTRCRKELSGRLTLKAILDILSPAGGWLSANEAWSRALPAADESKTVVWTEEARKAWFVALPMVKARDNNARMAFIAAYEREVSNAKNAGKRPQYEVSPGDDALLRDATISQAQTEGLLAPPRREDVKMLPDGRMVPLPVLSEQEMAANRQRIGEGMRELAKALRTGDTPEWMQEAAEKHRPAVMAANEQHEEKGV